MKNSAGSKYLNRWLASDLIQIFNEVFADIENTVLRGAGDEPIYLPALDGAKAQIVFTQDYYASALHEVAHWCLAGEERRQQVDYGYWYIPERNPEQQCDFEKVEARPQALESLLADAAYFPFQASMDNLAMPEYKAERFLAALQTEREKFKANGLPARAQKFSDALRVFYD